MRLVIMVQQLKKTWQQIIKGMTSLFVMVLVAGSAEAGEDYNRALKRAQYLLNATMPSDRNYTDWAKDRESYRGAVRSFLEHNNFYDVVLRYHERLYGTGLDTDYLDELLRDDIDQKVNKFARITCSRSGEVDARFRCYWSSKDEGAKIGGCPLTWEQPLTAFWYPGVVAWACPSVAQACGSDLSRCFIEYENENDARNAELGSTEIFDSRFSVVKSLSKQSAGLATAVVVANYPYTKILEPGLFAVDGAIAHLMKQNHHFDLAKLSLPDSLTTLVNEIAMTNTRFRLINTGKSYEQGGILSTFGWLRRYEKNRTRANQLYERLLCRKFTSELPRVFPQDPGNLRTTPGCMGCHATLDPLADFFKVWGEGGDLYTGQKEVTVTTFNNHSGSYISDLADIIRNDNAFATCQVEHAWTWLVGRGFYREEAELRAALTNYFVTVNYSFRELVYAIATHPAFIEGTRIDATVGDPLEEPPLGQPPGGEDNAPCTTTISFAADIQPKLGQCTNCHGPSSGNRQDLSTEAQWQTWGRQAVNMMASGNMPPGQAGPPRIGAVFDLKEAVRCYLEQHQ